MSHGDWTEDRAPNETTLEFRIQQVTRQRDDARAEVASVRETYAATVRYWREEVEAVQFQLDERKVDLAEARAEVERLRRDMDTIGRICFAALDEDADTEDTREIGAIVKWSLEVKR